MPSVIPVGIILTIAAFVLCLEPLELAEDTHC